MLIRFMNPQANTKYIALTDELGGFCYDFCYEKIPRELYYRYWKGFSTTDQPFVG